NIRADGERRQRQDVADDLPFGFAGAVARDPRERKGRVRRQALLDEARLSERKFVVGRLQALVAEERDLHRGIGWEWLREQAFGRVARAFGIVCRAHEGDLLLDALMGEV